MSPAPTAPRSPARLLAWWGARAAACRALSGPCGCAVAAFATLYVVGSELPKTHFLTSIDKVVTTTLVFLAIMAANSWVCYTLHEKGEVHVAEVLNQVVSLRLPQPSSAAPCLDVHHVLSRCPRLCCANTFRAFRAARD